MRRKEAEAAVIRHRIAVGVTALIGTAQLGISLSTKPGSVDFYRKTNAVAVTWLAGGALSALLKPRDDSEREQRAHPIVGPAFTGVIAFVFFYVCAMFARRIPFLGKAISGVLQYADRGTARSVLLTTLANGAAEEVFFRGALYDAAKNFHPVTVSTAVYALTTAATRNPALVFAAIAMGALFGAQRRMSGGIQAPLLTHVTWSTLMLFFVPPLFDQSLQDTKETS